MLNGPPLNIGPRLRGDDYATLATPPAELGLREEPPDLEELPHRALAPDRSLTHRQLELYFVQLAALAAVGDQQTIRLSYEPDYWIVGVLTTATALPAILVSWGEGGQSFVTPTGAGVTQLPHAALLGPKGTVRIPGRGVALTLLNRDAASQACLVYACRNASVELVQQR